jgi:hypothetical protein
MKKTLALLGMTAVLLAPSAYATNAMTCQVYIGSEMMLDAACMYNGTGDTGSFVATAGKATLVLFNDPAGATAQFADPSQGLHFLLTGLAEQPPDGGNCWIGDTGSVCVLMK